MSGKLEAISEISEEERSKKVEALWQQVLQAREADAQTPTLSPLDQKVSDLATAIPTDLFANTQSLPSEVTKLSVDQEMIEPKEEETTPIGKKEKKTHINLQWNNIKLAAKLDRLYSDRILGKGEDLKKQLKLQKELLDLKALLPKDTTGKKLELPEKAKELIEKLNTEHNLNLDKSDASALRVQIDSQLDTIKLEVNHGFTDLQTLNHERMLIFHVAQKQRDERDRIVANLATH